MKTVALVSALALPLGACGIKGALDAPPSAKAETTATADSGQGKPAGAAPKPHKDFILDSILR